MGKLISQIGEYLSGDAKNQSVHLLPSRLYCRYRNYTGSCLSARGLYRRSGNAPCPEDILFGCALIIALLHKMSIPF